MQTIKIKITKSDNEDYFDLILEAEGFIDSDFKMEDIHADDLHDTVIEFVDEIVSEI
jgi:hypothetical protein